MLTQESINLRKEALLLQNKRYENLLNKHLIAYDLIFINRDISFYSAIIKNILRWKSNKLCSDDYIKKWSKIIKSEKMYREIILNKDHPLNRSMLQNSPILGLSF